MSALNVNVKHAGKTHAVSLDTSAPPANFKLAIQQVTGVPPERMKVMIKGGVLKDDTDWKRVAPKAGQTFMVIGTAEALPEPPAKPIVFLEDLGDQDLAEALKMPVGFKNLGNTCYMNATLQTMRAIPELKTALGSFNGSGPEGRLALALRDVYANMERTTDGFVPVVFLQLLRQLVPQFAEQSRHGPGFAQQDAEECWTQIVNQLNPLPGSGSGTGSAEKKFVEQYMMGEFSKEMRCIEAPDEPATVTREPFKTLPCNITIATNYMQQGISDTMHQTIEKTSPSLGREAQYTQETKITRLPANLVVHMVRFAWRRDIGKKAKIMRKVKFPFELDASEWCSDDLKAKMRPAADKAKEVERDRRERAKVRRKTKSALGAAAAAGESSTSTAPAAADGDVPMTDSTTTPIAGGDLEPESTIRPRERALLDSLVHEDLKADEGASVTGLYELVGIVTHKGAGAESGHYIGFVRRDAFDGEDTTGLVTDEEVGWYKFDDDKVSIVPREKITALEGGGEDSVAYILLYRSKKF
ncbi:cysteine proteinase [Exidia glandulosa HHB12029]|uniref:Ubiquitin carboxyl-terminal hydrolase n=1 Tax=Exidia glandulosa HHB12029 TaxID=1314781 RepID=A0A165FYJ6_EXIGL|nr:cysteine proteinase [Exidia glandulosa HHB12029]